MIRRKFVGSAGSVLVSTLALTLIAGCAPNQEAVYVVGAQARAGDDCTLAPDTYINRGNVDLSFSTGYTAAFQILNNLQMQQAGSTNNGIDNSEVQMRDVDVKLSFPQDPQVAVDVANAGIPLEFNQILASTSLPAQTRGTAFVEIPDVTLDAIGQSIGSRLGTDVRLDMLLEVEFHARRSANDGLNDAGIIDVRPFTLPVEICFACLRDCTGCTGNECITRGPLEGTTVCGGVQDGQFIPICEEPTG